MHTRGNVRAQDSVRAVSMKKVMVGVKEHLRVLRWALLITTTRMVTCYGTMAARKILTALQTTQI